jgi:thioredoxin reductase
MSDGVLVVGAGPSGLTAATELARAGVRVTVIDRDPAPGGVPRACPHGGFGWRDLHRLLDGPTYARRLTELAARAGANILCSTTALGFDGARTVRLSGPLPKIRADAVLLATGCRERPRAARLVPGSRPAGVFTTGVLQELAMRGIRAGRRAVIVGAEHVSFSAVMTLASMGATIAAMITSHPRHQTVRGVAALLAIGHDFPIRCGARVAEIIGRRRVERVILDDGSEIPCDTVVFTGDFVPDHELARAAGVTIDPRTRGPRVDSLLRTSVPGVFAAGNLLHGAEPADRCALEGALAARAILAHLAGDPWPAAPPPIEVTPPLLWIAPSADRFVLRTSMFLPRGRLVVTQEDRVLHQERTPPLVPNRTVFLSASWIAAADRAQPITVCHVL